MVKPDERDKKTDTHIRFDNATKNRIQKLIEYEQQKLNSTSKKDVSTSSVARNGIKVYYDTAILNEDCNKSMDSKNKNKWKGGRENG